MGAKAKGGNFERTVATSLSLWWSKGNRDDIFWRTHGSGGRSTMRGKQNKRTEGQYGDISATDISGKLLIKNWCIECKTGYSSSRKNEVLTKDGQKKSVKQITNWCVLDAIDSKQNISVIDALWKQTYDQAIEAGNQPILIFQRPRMSPCIVFNLRYFNFLSKTFDIPDKHWIVLRGHSSIVIMSLNDFFNWIPDIRKAFK